MTINANTFESKMNRLEEIVRLIDKGELSLEDSLKLFQEGTGLVETCGKLLDDAELQIKKITAEADGQPVEEDFNE